MEELAMSKLTIQDLMALLQEKNGVSKKEAQSFVTAMFEVIQDGVNDDKIVKIKGLGTFRVVDVDARESINVNTGERVLIDGHSKISFTPDTIMKELVNKPFSGFETVVLNEGVNFDDMPEDGQIAEPVEETLGAMSEPVVEQHPAEDIQPIEELPEPAVEQAVETLTLGDNEQPVEMEQPVEEEVMISADMVEEPVVEIVENESSSEVATEKLSTEVATEELSTEVATEEPNIEVVTEDSSTEVVDEKPEEIAPLLSEPQEESVADAENELESIDEEEDSKTWEYTDDEPKPSTRRRGWGWILWLLLCAACFVIGYFVGHYTGSNQLGRFIDLTKSEAEVSVMDSVHADSTLSATKVMEETSTNPKEEASTEPKEETSTNPKEEASTEPKEDFKADTAAEVDYRKYEQMDVRVRTGAYRIVGTAQEVKAREGDTVERISKRMLGDGMSCYVEVYNNMKGSTPLQAGQVVKIPKLEFKKKKKQI